MPDEARSLPPLDFNRTIGCGILQFGNYGLPAELQALPPCRRVEPETQVEYTTYPDGTHRATVRSECGALTSCTRNSHPTRYPIETLEELRTARRMWEQTRFDEADGHEESFARTSSGKKGPSEYVAHTTPDARSPADRLGKFVGSYRAAAAYRRPAPPDGFSALVPSVVSWLRSMTSWPGRAGGTTGEAVTLTCQPRSSSMS